MKVTLKNGKSVNCGEYLDSGSYGNVYSFGQNRAIKICDNVFEECDYLKNTKISEVKSLFVWLKKNKPLFSVRLHDYQIKKTKRMYYIMDLLDARISYDLENDLSILNDLDMLGKTRSARTVRSLIKEKFKDSDPKFISFARSYLLSPICHTDIARRNVMMDFDGNIKFVDLESFKFRKKP